VWAAIGALIGAAWSVGLLWKLFWLSKQLRATGNSPALTDSSRYADQRRSTVVWLPASFATFAGAGVALFSAVRNPLTSDRALYGAAEFLVSGFALLLLYILAYRKWPGLFELRTLDHWYQQLPDPVKAMVQRATRNAPGIPSSRWRSIPDISQEVHYAGIALALFGEDKRRPIWRRSAKCLIWYFAPIVVPLVALFAAPLVSNIWSKWPGIDDTSKLLFGVTAFVWAGWSISYFVAMGTRDFGMALDFPHGQRHGLLAQAMAYPNHETRNTAARFFVGSGPTIFNIVVIAAVPAYAGYLGLFGAAASDAAEPRQVVEVHDASTRFVIQNSQVSCSGKDVEGPSISASASISSKRQLRVKVESNKATQDTPKSDCPRPAASNAVESSSVEPKQAKVDSVVNAASASSDTVPSK
jgi:hypothetical protein